MKNIVNLFIVVMMVFCFNISEAKLIKPEINENISKSNNNIEIVNEVKYASSTLNRSVGLDASANSNLGETRSDSDIGVIVTEAGGNAYGLIKSVAYCIALLFVPVVIIIIVVFSKKKKQ